MSEPLVSFKNVCKAYEGAAVLHDINIAVSEGDFVSIIGPSGCGKTTVLRMLAALTKVTSGELLIGGQPPAAGMRDLSYIFQDATLLPWRTTRRNIELPLELDGLNQKECHQTSQELLELVGLETHAGKYPRELSGGMRMRVSLARSLARSPGILLLDEPFGALDAMARNRLNVELLRLREQKPFTAFFVTHSVAEAVFLSSKITVLSAQPGRMKAVIDIPFNYPREQTLRERPDFHELVGRVSHLLHAEDGGGL